VSNFGNLRAGLLGHFSLQLRNLTIVHRFHLLSSAGRVSSGSIVCRTSAIFVLDCSVILAFNSATSQSCIDSICCHQRVVYHREHRLSNLGNLPVRLLHLRRIGQLNLTKISASPYAIEPIKMVTLLRNEPNFRRNASSFPPRRIMSPNSAPLLG